MIAKIMKIRMQTVLSVLRRQPHSVRCRPRDSEPQRVRFPVLVADGRSSALEKGPIQDLSKYQTSPKEQFNHRAAYFVISEAKRSPPFAEVRFCVLLSPCLSPFSFFFCSNRKSDKIENLRIRNRILFGVFTPKDGLRIFPAPSTKAKPLWLFLACDLSRPWLAKIISVRSTTELTNFISPYSQAVSNSCCHTRR